MKKLILISSLFFGFNLNAQCFDKVDAGWGNVIALAQDGSIWSWGMNYAGQLGIGNTIPQYTPVKIGSDNDWIFVETGESSTFAIKANGTLWSWGRNEFGQLGHGSMTNVWIPTQVGTDTDWKFVSNQSARTIAIKTDNTLWGWGSEPGPPDDPGFINSTTPVQIGTDTWNTVCVAQFCAFAIKSDGTLWAWGNTILGNGTTGGWTSHLTQIGTDNQWKSVYADQNAMAIKQDGSLWAWGYNSIGELGDGTLDPRLVPTRIGNANDWVSGGIGIGTTHAIKTDGSLWAWGANGWGQVGDGTTINRIVPTRIGTDNNWKSISSSGFRFTIGLKNDNTLWGWGMNESGAPTADGTNTENHVPVMIGCTALGTVSQSNTVFSYYPNPVKDYLFFKTIDATKVEVYDISGRILYTAEIAENKIDLTSLQSGNYILKIYTKNEVLNAKIIKE